MGRSEPGCAYYDQLVPPVGTNEIPSYRRSCGLLTRTRTKSTCHLLLSNISCRLRRQPKFSSTFLWCRNTRVYPLVQMKPPSYDKRPHQVFCAFGGELACRIHY